MRGHSVLELMLTVIIFSIFLLALTAIFSTGLKSWNLVQNKTETQQEASLCNMFLVKDFRHTDQSTLTIGGKGYEYAILQSDINEFGASEYDQTTGKPKWQAYILYYTFPRSKKGKEFSMVLTDPSTIPAGLDPNNPRLGKKLIRKILKHAPFINKKLTGFEIYFNDIDVKTAGEEYIGKPKVLSRHVYEMDLKQNPDHENAIDIDIIIVKSMLEDRLAFTKDFSDSAGKEKVILKNTVILNNTEQ
ncbi:MAG: hypothetical protein ABRQ38_23250 [Candidatus Eremiobacterota bacterium]